MEFDKNISNGVTESFKLYNRTSNEIRYRVYIEKSKEKDMSQWIEIYPQSISLKPLEEKELRLSVTPPKNAQAGEYKAKLVIKEIKVPNKKDDKKIASTNRNLYLLTLLLVVNLQFSIIL